MKPFFLSPGMQHEFEQNGFVRVPLLSPEACDKLMLQYKAIEEEHLKVGIPFITTSHTNDYSLIKKADDMISAALASPLEKIMCNYTLLFSNFLVKMPDENSATPAHQDSTFVDETEYESVSIWVSLQDTDERNGCMRFIKGSHKYLYSLRPTHFYPWAYANVRDRLEEMLESYPSKRGEAFIFTHSVIHGSFANVTTTPRVAVVMAAYPTGAQLYDFFLPKEEKNRVRKYKMNKDAYMAIVKDQPASKGEYVGDVFFDFVQLNEESFNKMLSGKSSAAKKRGLVTSLRNFVNQVIK